MSTNLFLASAAGSSGDDTLNGIITMGGELFESDIDAVIFQTNEFLTDASFTGEGGPFWMILQMCMCLGALFAIIAAAGMAYKMMINHPRTWYRYHHVLVVPDLRRVQYP